MITGSREGGGCERVPLVVIVEMMAVSPVVRTVWLVGDVWRIATEMTCNVNEYFPAPPRESEVEPDNVYAPCASNPLVVTAPDALTVSP